MPNNKAGSRSNLEVGIGIVLGYVVTMSAVDLNWVDPAKFNALAILLWAMILIAVYLVWNRLFSDRIYLVYGGSLYFMSLGMGMLFRVGPSFFWTALVAVIVALLAVSALIWYNEQRRSL